MQIALNYACRNGIGVLQTDTMKPVPFHREAKNGVLRARCEWNLETHFRNLAMLRRVDVSDVVREALRDYAARNAIAECQTTNTTRR